MKTISITGSVRENLGKTGAKDARNNDQVPCVMYGGGKQIHFTVDQKSFDKIIYTADVYNVILNIDGTEYSSLLKDAQFHPVTDKPVHADFLFLEDGKPVTVSLPIALTGSSAGVKNGGKLRTPMRKLKVKGELANMPENIEIDITKLRIGQSIKVGSLTTEGLEYLDPASNVIVAVKTARGAVQDDEEEEEEAAEAEA
ncbi:50S ribosomal protein L25/general stress protein Ctc [bacterium SCSIO 12643]|nr:50S ribosomal protein L25/general stress protein Ctc [bacterium SCSIO 12643]